MSTIKPTEIRAASYDHIPGQLPYELADTAAQVASRIRSTFDSCDFAYRNSRRRTNDVILIDAWDASKYPKLSKGTSLRESEAGRTWARPLIEAIDLVRQGSPRLSNDSGAQLFFVPPFDVWPRHRDLADTYRTVTGLKGAARVWVEDLNGGPPLDEIVGPGDTYGMQFTADELASPLHGFSTLGEERVALLLG